MYFQSEKLTIETWIVPGNTKKKSNYSSFIKFVTAGLKTTSCFTGKAKQKSSRERLLFQSFKLSIKQLQSVLLLMPVLLSSEVRYEVSHFRRLR